MWNWCFKELIVGCGLALIIGGGVWQNRQLSQPAAEAVDLAAIPRNLADWTSDEFQLPERELAAAGIDRYLGRDYIQAETGQAIRVLIVSGRGGPISVHPPEVCFAGRGYLADSAISTVKTPSAAGEPEHHFSTAIFRGPESSGGTRLQLFWSWSDSGIWQAPPNPRLAFARSPRLYKIYLSRVLSPQQGSEDVQAGVDFMKVLLPEFERLMSSAGRQPAGESVAAQAVPSLPLLVESRSVRRTVSQFSRPLSTLFPVQDGDFR